ncbi:hypothetical protein DIZ76_010570 [Coccidioides immitis]|nr:hypothetical protein DIZ76_010570 [Coccidioides immitis]
MNAKNKFLMDNIVRGREEAGLALIQRDLEHTQHRQSEADQSLVSTPHTARDNNIMHALTTSEPSTSKADGPGEGRQAAQNMRRVATAAQIINRGKGAMTFGMKISTLESQNQVLLAANEVMVHQHRKEKENLRAMNHHVITEIGKYKQRVECLAELIGISDLGP